MYRDNGVTAFHRILPENLRLYHAWGADSVFAECEEPMTNLFYNMRFWIGSHFMNDLNLDLDTETKRFMEAYYGEKAAPFMYELLQYVQKRNDSVAYPLTQMSLKARPDLDKEFFRTADALIEKALDATETELQKKHIRKERFVFDYDNLTKFRNQTSPDMKAFQQRMLADYRLNGPLYGKLDNVAKFEEKLKDIFLSLSAKVAPPQGFENYDIIHDIAWPLLKQPYTRAKLVDMPDAAGGKAIQTLDTNNYSGVTFGYYNEAERKQIKGITLPQANIPQDEKFHFYSLGEIELKPQGYFWAHPTWRIQQNAGEFFNVLIPEANLYHVFLSLKAEGPAYVKGSSKPNSLSLDRILLVRPKKAPVIKVAPPQGFENYDIIHDITGTFLEQPPTRAKLVDMPDAAGGKAIQTLDTNNYSGVTFGYYNEAERKQIKGVTVPQTKVPPDEKFHFYSLGEIELKPQGYFWAHPTWRIQQKTDKLFNTLLPNENHYHVFISLKAEGPAYVKGSTKPNSLSLDRLLLVRPKKN